MAAGATEEAAAGYSRVLGDSRYGAHALVAAMVGKGHRVLDVGCGEGALSKRLAEDGNEVLSLERDGPMAKAAAARGLQVVNRDIETDSIENLGPFDAIVCADVLEHLHDPRGALLKLRGRLTPEGRLICSIPNIAFYTVRLKVLLGEFEYTDGGIMDRTHLRFFTHQTARALLEEAGFRVSREEVSHYLSVGPAPLSRALNRLVERGSFGTAVHRVCLAFPGVFGYQFVTESVPSAP